MKSSSFPLVFRGEFYLVGEPGNLVGDFDGDEGADGECWTDSRSKATTLFD